MAAEDSVRQLDHFSAPGMTSVPVRTDGQEAGTPNSTWLAGSPIRSSLGLLIDFAEDAVAGLVGFACADATGTAATPVSYIPAVPGIEFEATLEDGTNGDHVLAQTNVFAKYALAVTATGLWYLDEDDTTNVAAVVIALVDPVGTVQGRVRARLLDTVTIYND